MFVQKSATLLLLSFVAAIIFTSSPLAGSFLSSVTDSHQDAYAQREHRDKACSNPRDPGEEDPPFCAHLIVIKQVEGGTAAASQFIMHVTGNNPSQTTFSGSESGTTVTIAQGSYQVTETPISGYTVSYSPECSGSISAGETKTCTIVNTVVPSEPGPCVQCFQALTPEQRAAFEGVLLGSGLATIEQFCDVFKDPRNTLSESVVRNLLTTDPRLMFPPALVDNLINCLKNAGVVFRP